MNDTLHNILQQQNNTLDSVFGLKNKGEKFNCLPCIYWLPKMHKIPSGARFIIADKKCINKQLSKHVTKLPDILYKVVDFVFRGGTRDYIMINKQRCASWSSKKRGHHFY